MRLPDHVRAVGGVRDEVQQCFGGWRAVLVLPGEGVAALLGRVVSSGMHDLV